jgi:hypothetical protein
MATAIWLDDCRDPSKEVWRKLIEAVVPGCDVIWAKDYDQFINTVLTTPDLEAIFFDNDLGPLSLEGRHAFTWFEKLCHEEGFGPVILFAQTANPAAKKELLVGFDSLRRFWGSRDTS